MATRWPDSVFLWKRLALPCYLLKVAILRYGRAIVDGHGARLAPFRELRSSEATLSYHSFPSYLDLKGLGKEHRREVDASKHIERERASWD